MGVWVNLGIPFRIHRVALWAVGLHHVSADSLGWHCRATEITKAGGNQRTYFSLQDQPTGTASTIVPLVPGARYAARGRGIPPFLVYLHRVALHLQLHLGLKDLHAVRHAAVGVLDAAMCGSNSHGALHLFPPQCRGLQMVVEIVPFGERFVHLLLCLLHLFLFSDWHVWASAKFVLLFVFGCCGVRTSPRYGLRQLRGHFLVHSLHLFIHQGGIVVVSWERRYAPPIGREDAGSIQGSSTARRWSPARWTLAVAAAAARGGTAGSALLSPAGLQSPSTGEDVFNPSCWGL
mmetsp:Transcript_28034/g.72484  ORF Transcript_28034/g.72484 Transcript_28034/m.72484 type:complete len:291 (+) Transcript_28034:1198-2070(+)